MASIIFITSWWRQTYIFDFLETWQCPTENVDISEWIGVFSILFIFLFVYLCLCLCLILNHIYM